MADRSSSPFVRGFKAQTQRIAADHRRALGLADSAPLDPRALAQHLGVKLHTPHDLPSLEPEHLQELVGAGSGAWSALTIRTASGTRVIYNPEHPQGRINNSLCHELSHLLLEHSHGSLHQVGDCVMRDFNVRQEKEADWLAGSLLLPETALKDVKRRGWDHAAAAHHFGVSDDLFRWRWHASGLDRYYPRSA